MTISAASTSTSTTKRLRGFALALASVAVVGGVVASPTAAEARPIKGESYMMYDTVQECVIVATQYSLRIAAGEPYGIMDACSQVTSGSYAGMYGLRIVTY